MGQKPLAILNKTILQTIRGHILAVDYDECLILELVFDFLSPTLPLSQL